MFEGVSSPALVKERQGEDRSSLGALHGRGLVSALNKARTVHPEYLYLSAFHFVSKKDFGPPLCRRSWFNVRYVH